MINKFTFLVCVSFCLGFTTLVAQPTLTSNFSPALGSSVVLTVGDTNNINEGAAGANVTWDFSNIQATIGNRTYTHIAPSTTPYASIYTDATLAYATSSAQNNKGFVYYKITPTSFENVGISASTIQMYYNNSQLVMKYPFTYNSNFTDAFSGSGTNSQNITTYRYGTVNTVADGWGTLILPQGTFGNVLRVRIEQNFVDSIHFMGNDIINVYRIITYNYFRDDIKQQLMGISYTYSDDGFGNDIITKSVLYYPDAPNSIKDLVKNGIKVYPNPAINNVTIKNISNMDVVNYTITDILGKEYSSGTINATTQGSDIDLSKLNSGIYLVSLFNDKTLLGTEKLIIKK